MRQPQTIQPQTIQPQMKFRKNKSHLSRSLTLSIVVVTAVAMSGCHWFGKKKSAYQQSAETRPLEVPPDLDLPSTEGALQIAPPSGQSVTRSSVAAPTQPAVQNGATGFNVPGDRDALFDKVGAALASIDGVAIASKAQLLGTYDVNYQGTNFLIRVTKVDAGVYISAVDPRGMPADNEAATKLIAAVKAAVGG